MRWRLAEQLTPTQSVCLLLASEVTRMHANARNRARSVFVSAAQLSHGSDCQSAVLRVCVVSQVAGAKSRNVACKSEAQQRSQRPPDASTKAASRMRRARTSIQGSRFQASALSAPLRAQLARCHAMRRRRQREDVAVRVIAGSGEVAGRRRGKQPMALPPR